MDDLFYFNSPPEPCRQGLKKRLKPLARRRNMASMSQSFHAHVVRIFEPTLHSNDTSIFPSYLDALFELGDARFETREPCARDISKFNETTEQGSGQYEEPHQISTAAVSLNTPSMDGRLTSS